MCFSGVGIGGPGPPIIDIYTYMYNHCMNHSRCIKIYLSNSMTQHHLNYCVILHVLREITDNLNLTEIAFIEKNEMKRIFWC